MANENQVQVQIKKDDKFNITTRSGEVINLSKSNVIKYLTDNTEITDSEFNMFFQMCKANKVNPFLKEAYIVKYGTQPATIVLDYKVLQQVAETNSSYKGMKHGVIIQKPNGEIEERLGEYIVKGETLIAGWCEVYRKDRDMPTKVVAMFDEFKGIKKSTGELNSNWSNKPCFMIVKVAKAQALREAFPNLFNSNVYVAEEMDCFEEKGATKPTQKFDNSLVKEEIIEEEPTFDENGVEVEEPTEKVDETILTKEDLDYLR